MGRARQTVERRQLGLALRRLRTEAGKSQHDAAEVIGKVRSRIIELEDGRSAATEDDLAKLLDFYEVSAQERKTVLAIGVEARKRQRRRTYTDLLPGAFQRFADLEASAAEIYSYECTMIPGLLQAPAYIRALIEEGDGLWWEPSADEREQRISFRLDRQKRTLDAGHSKSLHFVLTEDALRATVGSPELMREQHEHLLSLSEREDTVIQAIPGGNFDNPARGGGFSLFSFGSRGDPVAFANVVFGPSTYFHDDADTATMFRVFNHLRELALDTKKSRQLLDRIAKGD